MPARIAESIRFIALFFILSGVFVLGGCDPEFEDDLCTSNEDCFADESCQDDRCVFEANACGGQEILVGEPGDPCGPCDLDELVCSSTNDALLCDGRTACPKLTLELAPPTAISATSATVSAELVELPLDGELEQLGFCWSSSTATPDLGDHCLDVDTNIDAGDVFDAELQDLDGDTRYFVRAFAVIDDQAPYFSSEQSFVTDASSPR